jgi:DNA polymerase III subunit epsilon
MTDSETLPHAARVRANHWAQALFDLDDFLVLDTETTGTSARDEVIQIGVVNKHGETLLDALIKPTIPIPPFVTGIHGITDAMVQGKPPFPAIYDDLAALFDGKPIIVYNAPFDKRLLQQTAQKWALPPLDLGAMDCAMKMYARFYGEKQRNKRNYRWKSLKFACETEGIERVNAHWAINDCRMTLELLRKMAAG